MTFDAALWAGSTALTGKAALAFWTAALLFQSFDRRKVAISWQILLLVFCIAGCIASSVHAAGPVTRWMWVGSAAIAVISARFKIRQWTRTSPRETYEETSQLDSSTKKKSNALPSSGMSKFASPKSSIQWIVLAGLAVAAAAIAISVYASMPLSKSNARLGTIHVLAACVLWGVAIFSAVELTFGSAPLSLSAVSWRDAANIAIACWIAESYVSATIVLSPVDDSVDFQSVAMSRLFAISILLMDFVVWMIPHRVATFKRTGKATEWVSLTMSAWLGALSLAVLCALPSTWPWQLNV